MASFLTGKNGCAVVAGGSSIPLKSWKAKFAKDELDTTNTGSNGARSYILGLEHVEFTVEGLWDAAKFNPFSSDAEAPSVTVGDYLNLLFSVDCTNAQISIDNAMITAVDIDVAEDAIVKYTISGKSSGS